jgi:hypothetical protein
MTELPAFSFLDAKILAQLAALLLIWIQWSKDLIPEGYIKYYSLASAGVFIFLVDLASRGSLYPTLALYAIVAASATGLGYNILTAQKSSSKSSK